MLELSNFENIEYIYRLTSLILSIGLIIASLEDLKVFDVFSDGGLLSWSSSRLISRQYCRGLSSKIAAFFLSETAFKISLYVKLVAATALLVSSLLNLIFFPIFLVLFLSHALIFLRTPYSLDGGYQMSILILLALTIGSGFGAHTLISQISIIFVAAQLILSYFISGLTKLLSPLWRKSHAMTLIFSTKIYGHPYIYKLVDKSKLIAYLSCWAVISFELLFFSTIFFNPTVGLVFLTLGLLFHLGNAIFMGLNDFLLSFSASYPCFIYLLVKKSIFFT